MLVLHLVMLVCHFIYLFLVFIGSLINAHTSCIFTLMTISLIKIFKNIRPPIILEQDQNSPDLHQISDPDLEIHSQSVGKGQIRDIILYRSPKALLKLT